MRVVHIIFGATRIKLLILMLLLNKVERINSNLYNLFDVVVKTLLNEIGNILVLVPPKIFLYIE